MEDAPFVYDLRMEATVSGIPDSNTKELNLEMTVNWLSICQSPGWHWTFFLPLFGTFFVNFLRQHDFSTNRLSIFRSGFSDSIWSQNLQNSDCRQVHSLYGHGGTVIALDYGLDLLLRRSCAAVGNEALGILGSIKNHGGLRLKRVGFSHVW
jgi:hypothetical protein